jgi:hypothetical protein
VVQGHASFSSRRPDKPMHDVSVVSQQQWDPLYAQVVMLLTWQGEAARGPGASWPAGQLPAGTWPPAMAWRHGVFVRWFEAWGGTDGQTLHPVLRMPMLQRPCTVATTGVQSWHQKPSLAGPASPQTLRAVGAL